MRKLTAAAGAAVLALACAGGAQAQQRGTRQGDADVRALRQEIEALREGQREMQEELREIKQLLQQLAENSGQEGPKLVSVDDDPSMGEKTAKVVIVDFSDYQCPFCARFVRETKPQIVQNYIKTGKVRYVFRDLPLESIHPHAFKAAEAANCAGEQGKFWEMHELLFQNARALAPAALPTYAQTVGLDGAKFAQCLQSGKYAAEVRKDMADAGATGVQGTPGFVIGIVNPKDPSDPKLRIFTSFAGAQPYSTFKSALDAALAEAETAK